MKERIALYLFLEEFMENSRTILRTKFDENFTKNNINELESLDKSIFDPYWQNSEAAFIETLDSCNQNYLFKQYDEDLLVGYAILGVTRNFSFLQRFGISLGYQNKGHGSELLKNVLNFAKGNKYINSKDILVLRELEDCLLNQMEMF
mgnify:CR=1 FL=1